MRDDIGLPGGAQTMKHVFALVITLLLTALPLAGCAAADTTTPTAVEQELVANSPTAAEQDVNFRLLISDEPNDIGDFTELWVTISAIGFVQGDEECVLEAVLDPPLEVNLAEFQGEDAAVLWEGYAPDGDYTKIFLYVDTTVTGVLAGGGEEIEVKLPSNKLHLNLPFTVGDEPEGEAAEFVFDITVHRAGNSGQYILKPQLSDSGEGKRYRLLEHTEERVRTGKPDWSGKPDDAGKPEQAGVGAAGGPQEDAGNPADAGKPRETGKPEWAGQPGGSHSTDEDSQEPEDS
jgi:hypothetical protein